MKKTCVLIMVMMLCNCATLRSSKDQWKTRIDPMGFSAVTFDADHNLCSQLAWNETERARNEALVRAGVGAVAGAGVGLLTAVVLGKGAGTKVGQQVAGLGALYGAGVGAASVRDKTEVIYFNCMRNRGYQLLW